MDDHIPSAMHELDSLKLEVESAIAILRASGFQGNTLSEIVDDLWKTATADREALTIAKHDLTVAQGARRAQYENHRAQLATATGRAEAFENLLRAYIQATDDNAPDDEMQRWLKTAWIPSVRTMLAKTE